MIRNDRHRRVARAAASAAAAFGVLLTAGCGLFDDDPSGFDAKYGNPAQDAPEIGETARADAAARASALPTPSDSVPFRMRIGDDVFLEEGLARAALGLPVAPAPLAENPAGFAAEPVFLGTGTRDGLQAVADPEFPNGIVTAFGDAAPTPAPGWEYPPTEVTTDTYTTLDADRRAEVDRLWEPISVIYPECIYFWFADAIRKSAPPNRDETESRCGYYLRFLGWRVETFNAGNPYALTVAPDLVLIWEQAIVENAQDRLVDVVTRMEAGKPVPPPRDPRLLARRLLQ